MLTIGCTVPKQQVNIQQGVLDFSQIDYDSTKVIPLTGEWVFHWNHLLTPKETIVYTGKSIEVPSYWNNVKLNGEELSGNGYGTYVLKIINIPEGLELGLKIPYFHSSYRMWINDNEIASNGTVGKTPESSIPFSKPKLSYLNLKDSALITIQVSNFHHKNGGIRHITYLGNFNTVQKYRDNKFTFDFFLLGSIFIMSLYHLSIFFLQPKEKSPLYFGLLCLLIVIRLLCSDEILILNYLDLTWSAVMTIEYLTFFLAVPVFVNFLQTFYPKEISGIAVMAILLLGGLFSLITILTPASIFTYLATPYQLITMIVGIYCLITLVKSINQKREGSVIFLAGYLFLFAGTINDILYYNELSPFNNLGPFSLFVFFFSQAFLIAKRFSKAYNIIEAYSHSLEKEVQERTQELANNNEQLKLLNHEKDRMIDIVAHDLKAPFNRIKGFTQLVNMTGKLSEEQNTYMSEINKMVKRGLNLIRDLLDMHSIEHTEGNIQMKEIAINDLINQWSHAYFDELDKKNQTLHLSIKENIKVTTDEDKITRILDNLLSNAIKFSEKSTNIFMSISKDQENLVISVRDEGQGISDEDRNLMFKRFQKLSATPTAGESSSGLGLSIIKELVDKLGGTIEVKSKVGKGSEFIIRLPLEPTGTKKQLAIK